MDKLQLPQGWKEDPNRKNQFGVVSVDGWPEVHLFVEEDGEPWLAIDNGGDIAYIPVAVVLWVLQRGGLL